MNEMDELKNKLSHMTMIFPVKDLTKELLYTMFWLGMKEQYLSFDELATFCTVLDAYSEQGGYCCVTQESVV